MYLYKMALKNGSIYIIKSKKNINEILEGLTFYEWGDFVLAEPMNIYVKDKVIKNNIIMVKSDHVVSFEYYVSNPIF